MLHTKMCNDRTYVAHEYEMFSVRTDVTYEHIIFRTYVIHENMMSGVRNGIT